MYHRLSSLVVGTCLGLLLFCGASLSFVPVEAPTPASGIYQPTFSHQAKKEIAEQPAWLEFVQEHGPGYRVVWDEFTGTPHRVIGPSIRVSGHVSESNIEEVCRQFIQDNARLLQVDYNDLRLSSAGKYGRVWYVTYGRYYRGVPVYMGRIDLRLDERGMLVLFGSDSHPGIDLSINPTIAEKSAIDIVKNHLGSTSPLDSHLFTKLYVYPTIDVDQLVYHLAYQIVYSTARPLGKWVYFVDAHNGQILGYYNDLKFVDYEGYVTGMIQEDTPFDPWVNRSFKDLRVDVVDIGYDHTDAEGYYLVPYTGGENHDVEAELKGFWVDVNNQNGSDAHFLGNFPPGEVNIHWDDPNSTGPERCGYYHTVIVHDFIKWLEESYTGTDYQMGCNVSVAGECNAYWDGSSINFYRAGGGCPEIAQIADVVYHEYGHGVTEFLYGSHPLPYWDESGGLNEGWSDFLGGVITDQHLIGRGFWGQGTWIRNLEDPDHSQYPGEECGGEPHCMGEIIGGAIWDIRNNLIAVYGEEYGKIYMDSLWHYPRYGYPTTFYDYLVEQLVFDDDNGNIYDGTPNYTSICDAYAQHDTVGDPGMLCPEIQYGVFIVHDPLEDTPDTVNSHPVVATMYSTEGAMDPDSLLLFYCTDGGPLLPLVMSPVGGDEYQADVPPQPNGTFVDYYLLGVDVLGNRKTHPEGAPSFLHSFYVGTFDTAFVDDMEAGIGDWTHYAVTGGYEDMWSLRSHRNHTPGGSSAWKCGDSTQYGGNYGDFLDAALVTAPVEISDHSKLIFWHWMNAETSASYAGKCYDGGMVEMSLNGGPFEQITPEGGYRFEIRSDYNSGSPFPGGTPLYSGQHDWETAKFVLEGYEGWPNSASASGPTVR
jgi:Zn-dependent metalloprotease